MSGLRIEVQPTPNPNAAKFVLDREVAARGTTYRDPAAAEPAWAHRLLAVPGVAQVFALNNFISVTKYPDAGWDGIVPQVEQILQETLSQQGG